MANKKTHGSGHLHKRGYIYYYKYMINGKVKDVSLRVADFFLEGVVRGISSLCINSS